LVATGSNSNSEDNQACIKIVKNDMVRVRNFNINSDSGHTTRSEREFEDQASAARLVLKEAHAS
jgi:hypothetical protein